MIHSQSFIIIYFPAITILSSTINFPLYLRYNLLQSRCYTDYHYFDLIFLIIALHCIYFDSHKNVFNINNRIVFIIILCVSYNNRNVKNYIRKYTFNCYLCTWTLNLRRFYLSGSFPRMKLYNYFSIQSKKYIYFLDICRQTLFSCVPLK